MKTKLFASLLMLGFSLTVANCVSIDDNKAATPAPQKVNPKMVKLKQKAREAKAYVSKNGMNQDWCILIDYSYDLNTKRFFIYDLKNDRLEESALVSHGYGGNSTDSYVEFSNVPGSNCSSEGKFRLGIRSYSNWGVHFHYKMHGLENTNSNAYKRYIVLHSYEYAYCDSPTTASQGCPIVCDDMMNYIDTKVKRSSNKDILLWIYK